MYLLKTFTLEIIHKQKKKTSACFFLVLFQAICHSYRCLQMNASFLTRFDKDNLRFIPEIFVITKIGKVYFTFQYDKD